MFVLHLYFSIRRTNIDLYNQFKEIGDKLKHYGDMQDLEFTIERGKLFILQTRNIKRTAQLLLK